MTTWQYQLLWFTLSPTDWTLSNELNMLGTAGWELVTVEPSQQAGQLQYLFIFKKQLS
jgi:hypothetical protein